MRIKDFTSIVLLTFVGWLVGVNSETQCLYDFENSREGWVVQSHWCTLGATSAKVSELMSKTGDYSLAVTLDLSNSEPPCFKLTKDSLAKLSQKNIPNDTLAKLNTLKEQDDRTEEHFISDLEATIGREQTDLYKSMILKCAKKPGRFGQGEVYVDLLSHSPGSLSYPLDLEGKTITAYVYFPFEFEGYTRSPNGVQLFAKSVYTDSEGVEHWKSLYGYWINATGQSDDWMRVRLLVSDTPQKGIYIEDGFDPKKVRFIGLKFAIGGNAPSSIAFSGDIFVDCISW